MERKLIISVTDEDGVLLDRAEVITDASAIAYRPITSDGPSIRRGEEELSVGEPK